MATIVCKRLCPFRGKSGFCVKDTVMLNEAGSCSEWYGRRGEPLAHLWTEPLPKEEEKQEPPHEEK